MKIRYHLGLFIHDQITKIIMVLRLCMRILFMQVRIKMADSQPCDYTEYISRHGRSKLAHLLYEIAVEKVKQDRGEMTGKKKGKGRPRGDAYKLASEWVEMSKTNFYNLIQGHYATSNVMVNHLINECCRRRPNEVYEIIRRDLVNSQRKLDIEIEKLTKKFSPMTRGENRSFPRRILIPQKIK